MLLQPVSDLIPKLRGEVSVRYLGPINILGAISPLFQNVLLPVVRLPC